MDEGLVGVPHAVEKTLPELLGVIVGEGLGLRGKPRLEEEAKGFLSGGFVAARQLLDQRPTHLGRLLLRHSQTQTLDAAALTVATPLDFF